MSTGLPLLDTLYLPSQRPRASPAMSQRLASTPGTRHRHHVVSKIECATLPPPGSTQCRRRREPAPGRSNDAAKRAMVSRFVVASCRRFLSCRPRRTASRASSGSAPGLPDVQILAGLAKAQRARGAAWFCVARADDAGSSLVHRPSMSRVPFSICDFLETARERRLHIVPVDGRS